MRGSGRRRGAWLERLVELGLAVPVAIVMTPLLVGLATVSALVYKANPVFTQSRVGRYGRPFTLRKIRSLRPSVPDYANREEIASFEVDGWGRFLRRTHLDELPQIWSVVMGTMSLVGPRPMIQSIVDQMTPETSSQRHSVRPGITGLWQISGARSTLVTHSLEWDLTYVRSQSLRLDLWILRRTLAMCLGAAQVDASSLPAWLPRGDDDRPDSPAM